MMKPIPSLSKNNLPCRYGPRNQKANGSDVISVIKVLIGRGRDAQNHSIIPRLFNDFSRVTGTMPYKKNKKVTPIAMFD